MACIRLSRLIGSVAASASLLVMMGAVGAGTASASSGKTLYVAAHPTAQTGVSCKTAKYSTIQAAVTAASSGDTVVVCGGQYNEDVYVAKPLDLKGRPGAVISGTTTPNGMCTFLTGGPPIISGCLAAVTIASSHVRVSGFTIKNAQGEGVLATGSLAGPITDVWIGNNVVTRNDVGGGPNAVYPECQGQEPDCGEGVHFMGVRHSWIVHNKISHNSGGVLITDELGPTDDNLIAYNVVVDNFADCGITMPGHNPFAYDSATKTLKPTVAGVFDNTVSHNVIADNGLKGFGAGVLIAVPIPGSASYDNLITDNYIVNNGLAGVTLHDHLPGGAYTSGNKIIGNRIGTNNVTGDQFDTNPPAPDTVTTAVIVYSGADPVSITISKNVAFDNKIGLWRTTNVTVSGLATNVIHNIATPVFSTPPM